MSSYAEFLERKQLVDLPTGFSCGPEGMDERLFLFQREIVAWALTRGRAAIFADTGLGKSRMQASWAQWISLLAAGDVLILAPLAVAAQTVREAACHDIAVTHCRELADVRPGVNIVNYERLERFESHEWVGIVLDESAILRNFSGTIRQQIQAFAEKIPYRLACTATPVPNDLLEITNHSEFVGALGGREMLSLFFIGDEDMSLGGKRGYRLKRHAQHDFYRFLNSWAVALRKPSDLRPEYNDDGYILPPLETIMHTVDADAIALEGRLFGIEASTLAERLGARRSSITERVGEACAIVAAEPGRQWLLWCNLNAESEALTRAIPGAVEVRGSHDADYKERTLLAFADGKIPVLVSKPSIAGHGLNLQRCSRMVFVGPSDSWEGYYQAVRRCWRFGQRESVKVHVVASHHERQVVENVKRKERQAVEMMDGMIDEMGKLRFGRDFAVKVERDERAGDDWRMILGSSVRELPQMEEGSVHLSVFSPPFPGMYLYSNSPEDVGNAKTLDELMAHLAFIVEPLLRVTMPGRLACLHLMQLPEYKTRDGYAGIIDFRGATIQTMSDVGWNYAGEACIQKNPQIQATRHKEHGLLFKTLSTDASCLRMALADYLLCFRKPGDNPIPIRAGMSEKYNPREGWITQQEWIEWAAPVWLGIKETDTLDPRTGRDEADERHLAPLQLEVVERAVKLWSNPRELVLSPFAGIGTEGVVSLRLNRRFVGVELKRSYWHAACRNLAVAKPQTSLLDLAEVVA